MNGAYHSAIRFALTSPPEVVAGYTSIPASSSNETVNFSASPSHKPWRLTAYVTNLLDRQNYLAPAAQLNQLNNLTNDLIVNPPLEAGLRVAYSFGEP